MRSSRAAPIWRGSSGCSVRGVPGVRSHGPGLVRRRRSIFRGFRGARSCRVPWRVDPGLSPLRGGRLALGLRRSSHLVACRAYTIGYRGRNRARASGASGHTRSQSLHSGRSNRVCDALQPRRAGGSARCAGVAGIRGNVSVRGAGRPVRRSNGGRPRAMREFLRALKSNLDCLVLTALAYSVFMARYARLNGRRFADCLRRLCVGLSVLIAVNEARPYGLQYARSTGSRPCGCPGTRPSQQALGRSGRWPISRSRPWRASSLTRWSCCSVCIGGRATARPYGCSLHSPFWCRSPWKALWCACRSCTASQRARSES